MFAGHETRLLAAKAGFLGGHRVLDALVHGAGGGGSGHHFVALWLDGRRVNASIVRRNRVSWLDVAVCFEDRASPLDDAPLIELRTETRADESHKRQELVREVQLGVASFDRRVFVDNRCTDDEARRVLGDGDVRAAVMLLLSAGHGPISISERQVAVRLRVDDVPDDFDVEQLVSNLLTIASSGPPAATQKVRRGEGLLIATGLAAVLMTCVFFAVVVACQGLPAGFAFIGVVAALLTAVASWWSMRGLVSGDSGSGARRRWLVGLTSYVVLVTVSAALTAINVGFDDSPPKRVTGHVSELRTGSKNRVTPIVRWADGSETMRSFDQAVTVGTRCSEDRHVGALGAEWHENLRVEWR